VVIAGSAKAQDEDFEGNDSTTGNSQADLIIKQVNEKSAVVNNIISTGGIVLKTPKHDNTASIDLKVRKNDELWFKIDGPLGIDVASGYFKRTDFIFVNSLQDRVVTGPSSAKNIGLLTKIRVNFDDLMNVFSGTVRITKKQNDTIFVDEDANEYIVSLKGANTMRKYWVSKKNYSVRKSTYYNNKNEITLNIDYSGFLNYNGSYYARNITITRPKQREYFAINLEKVTLNNGYMSFGLDIPSGVKRIKLK
jgi:hypothetical protein